MCCCLSARRRKAQQQNRSAASLAAPECSTSGRASPQPACGGGRRGGGGVKRPVPQGAAAAGVCGRRGEQRDGCCFLDREFGGLTLGSLRWASVVAFHVFLASKPPALVEHLRCRPCNAPAPPACGPMFLPARSITSQQETWPFEDASRTQTSLNLWRHNLIPRWEVSTNLAHGAAKRSKAQQSAAVLAEGGAALRVGVPQRHNGRVEGDAAGLLAWPATRFVGSLGCDAYGTVRFPFFFSRGEREKTTAGSLSLPAHRNEDGATRPVPAVCLLLCSS